MRAIVQRVNQASVTVEDEVVAGIDSGLLVYLGVQADDGETDVNYIAEKITGLRIFEDVDGKMNLDLTQSGGQVLVISAFSLLADARKGRRPSFTHAAPPELAQQLYNCLIEKLRSAGLDVRAGRFREFMKINSQNAGPVCILLDSRRLF